ncbi:MAG: TorF family putative porin [Alphaproteobacteria bacterium]|nr:TorF family putative porin [Alphaproteobacteria bacterium]
MNTKLGLISSAVALALAGAVAATPANAGDWFNREAAGSIKDAPMADSGRSFELAFNIGGTSDYVFRGISQTLEDPTVQGGIDASYGIFYAGVWASGVDFVRGDGGTGSGDATVEVDVYGGIKPKLGPVGFDLGVIGYLYPGAEHLAGADLDYLEIKAGASYSIGKLSLTGAVYYSPDQFAESGEAWTPELIAAYELPSVGIFSPSISGTIGSYYFDADALDYTYWNVGLSVAVEKLTLDFRYHDTDSNGADFCADRGLCDERFVFSAKVALP